MKSDRIRNVSKLLREKLSLGEELHNNEVLIGAEETGDENVFKVIVNTLASIEEMVNKAVTMLEQMADVHSKQMDEGDIDEIAAIATEFDKSGDEFLQKQASVLDQLLVNFAQISGSQAKLAQEKEIEKIRAEYRAKSQEECYKNPQKELKKNMGADAAIKAINKQIKVYRPMEAPLSTRTCPDHPGAQISRVADCVYQCSLDHKIYNYKEGFKTMNGNEVPGTDVGEQTRAFENRNLESMSFCNREEKLSQSE